MKYPQDLSGIRFGKLIAQKLGAPNGTLKTWICQCDCGNSKTVMRRDLISGDTGSCGCIRPGISRTGAGVSWQAMMTRCYNTNTPAYESYGKAGVMVCEFLRASPVNLVLFLGERPEGSSIDRKDCYGSYTCGQCAECLSNEWPNNVRWATKKEQNRNQKDLRYIEINGVKKCVGEWAEITGIGYRTIMARTLRGITGEALFEKPKDMKRYVTINGITKPAKEWSSEYGIKHDTFLGRMDRGITGDALIAPVNPNYVHVQ